MPRIAGTTPVFQAFLALHQPAALPRRQGLGLTPRHLRQQEGQFDVALELTDHGDALVGALKVRTDLFDRSTAEVAHDG